MTTISSGISGSGNWGGMQPQRMDGRGGKPPFSKIDTDGSVSQTELDKGMKPPGHDDGGSQNGFGSMGMDTQSFASMMAAGMGIGSMNGMGGSGSTSSTSSTSSTDEAQQALFNLIDSDQSGDISTTEVSSFQDKMKALFEKMQQMGAQQFSSETSSVSLTA